MPAHTAQDIDQRQQVLEKNVKTTAEAAVLHLDALVAIERRLMHIQFALWAVVIALALVFFGTR